MICSWCSGELSYDYHEVKVSVNRSYPVELSMCGECFKKRLDEYGRSVEGCVAMTFDIAAEVVIAKGRYPAERN